MKQSLLGICWMLHCRGTRWDQPLKRASAISTLRLDNLASQNLVANVCSMPIVWWFKCIVATMPLTFRQKETSPDVREFWCCLYRWGRNEGSAVSMLAVSWVYRLSAAQKWTSVSGCLQLQLLVSIYHLSACWPSSLQTWDIKRRHEGFQYSLVKNAKLFHVNRNCATNHPE